MNVFYDLRRNHSPQAWSQLALILTRYPNDVMALKEAGYHEIALNRQREALIYFLRVYALTKDPMMAMQIGYSYNILGENVRAYRYFHLATQTTDLGLEDKAQHAMTVLRGTQMKLLPDPFFFDITATPLYHSRFKLMIYRIIAHLGTVLSQKYQWQLYVSYRRTEDNKSRVNNALQIIYEDSTAITALGSQVTPFPTIPLVAFVEVGKAVDLVYRGSSRWDSDLRTGFAYFNQWGAPVTYTLHPTFPLKQAGDIYADLIYFTRYHDLINTYRVREGVRLFEYNSTQVDVYLKGFLSLDGEGVFYNNIFECGPGVALTPFNRYNVVLRMEMLRGQYLPIASNNPPNPYRANYHNNLVELDMFIRL